ncbi:MAG: O-antigen ligase family protein [Opitutaceae bacterium]|nr:O-antigen ligase family protein [Opitutaceae bacterium]
MDTSAARGRFSWRFIPVLEWGLVLLLASSLAWTTLCLGGYRPETMVWTSTINLAVAVLASVLAAFGVHRPWRAAALWPLPFLLYALANTLWVSPVAWLAWREWFLFLQMWLVFAVVLHFGRTKRQTGMLMGLILLLGVVSTAMAVYQRFADPDWLMLGRRQVEQYLGRAAGPFGIPNSLAALFEIVLMPCLVIAITPDLGKGVRLVCGILAALFGFGLVLSVSRGAMIGLGLAILFWPMLAGGEWRKRLAGLVIAGAGVAFASIALYAAVPSVRGRIEPLLHGKWEASRLILWRAGWEVFCEYPWLGSGAASYNVVFEEHRPARFIDEPQWAHNDYLNTLSDYGLVGFALFLTAGAGLFWTAWRKMQEDPARLARSWRLGALLGIVAFSFHLFVDFHLKIPALALMVAVVFGLLLREENAGMDDVSQRPRRWSWLAVGAMMLVLGFVKILPAYRAEALRYVARQPIDEYAATGQGDLGRIVERAEKNLDWAVNIDPSNAQAWADLAYVKSLQAYLTPARVVLMGVAAEKAARRATDLSQAVPEFWLRLGVALDMQGRQAESEPFFLSCLRLAPKASHFWYYYAYHLSGIPGGDEPARAAIATCLELDPNSVRALSLREQLNGRR